MRGSARTARRPTSEPCPRVGASADADSPREPPPTKKATDVTEQKDLEKLKAQYFYPNGVHRMACPPDEDGAPTCMGDTGYCGYSPELDTQVCVHLDAQSQS